MDIKESYDDKKSFARIKLLQKFCDDQKLERDVVKDKIIEKAIRVSNGGFAEKLYRNICQKKKKTRKASSSKGIISCIKFKILEFFEGLLAKMILKGKKKSVSLYYMEYFSKMDSLNNSISNYEKEIKALKKNLYSINDKQVSKAILVIGKRKNVPRSKKCSYIWHPEQKRSYTYSTTYKVRKK